MNLKDVARDAAKKDIEKRLATTANSQGEE